MPLLKPYSIIKNYNRSKDMTLVVAGKFKNQPFLMTDCVGSTINGLTFVSKLRKVRSNSNTYFSTVGSDNFARAIEIYDEDCHNQNTSIDFNSNEFIDEIIDIFRLLTLRHEIGGTGLSDNGFNRIYIIEPSNIMYYDIQFDQNHENPEYTTVTVDDNHIISALFVQGIPKPIGNTNFDTKDIYNSCVLSIKIAAYADQIDLKNKWSFISFEDGNIDYRVPYINKREHVLAYVGASYSEII